VKLYVLTEEPYHDNSDVLGVWSNRADAIKALLAVDVDAKGSYGEVWELTEWDDGGAKGESLARASVEHSMSFREFGGKPFATIHSTNYHRNKYEAVDPWTYDWVRREAEWVNP
jgi:hypothetical protein